MQLAFAFNSKSKLAKFSGITSQRTENLNKIDQILNKMGKIRRHLMETGTYFAHYSAPDKKG